MVEAVNYNSPGQVVIAGEAEAVKGATPALQALGCKVMPLPVSAPFHSSLMQPAEERLAPHLHDTPFSDSELPIYVNVDAAPVTTAEAARDALIRQVSRPVRWQESVERMVADGVTLCVEIGAGKVLSGLIRRIDKRRQVRERAGSWPTSRPRARPSPQRARGCSVCCASRASLRARPSDSSGARIRARWRSRSATSSGTSAARVW